MNKINEKNSIKTKTSGFRFRYHANNKYNYAIELESHVDLMRVLYG